MNRYFFIDETGKQRGTFSPEELRKENIKRETLVWTQGMEQWMRADEVSDLNYIFEQSVEEVQPQILQNPVYAETVRESREPMPKTWLIESILVTLLPFVFCGSFLSLLGIIAIVYSAQVESFYIRGDYSASVHASKSAGKWTKITLWIFIAWIVLIITALILLFGFLSFNFSDIGDLINT